MAKAAIVMVNYGSSALIVGQIERLEPGGDLQLVVVDCFTDTAERERIRALGEIAGVYPVLLDDNRGYGGGSNAGVQRAQEIGASVVVMLNPDTVASRDAMLALATAAAADQAAIVSPHIVDQRGKSWFAGSDLYLDDGSIAGRRRRHLHEGRPRRPWATGACFATSMTMWQRVGGFDEEYFLYWEDVDLSHRVLDAGGRLELLDVEIVHDEGGTHDDRASEGKSPTYYRYSIRNRLLYAVKHMDAAGIRSWRRASIQVSYRILLQGGRRQLLNTEPWRAGIRGLREGFAYGRRPRSPM